MEDKLLISYIMVGLLSLIMFVLGFVSLIYDQYGLVLVVAIFGTLIIGTMMKITVIDDYISKRG